MSCTCILQGALGRQTIGRERDYLTVPADQIKDITSVLTIVGGRVVHDNHRR